MRLLSVIHGPAFGGAHNQAMVLHRPLLERGIETLVVLPAEAEEAAMRLRERGLEVVLMPLGRLRATPDPRQQARFLTGLRGDIRRLGQAIAEQRAEVVQVHGPTNPQGAIAARKSGKAVVWQILDSRAPALLRRAAMPYVKRAAGAVTVWGEELARMHPGALSLGERLVGVFPPVESALLRPDAELRREARLRLGVQEDEVLIASLGVLNPQKGHDSVLRAGGVLTRTGRRVTVRILGADSPAHPAYKRMLEREARHAGLANTVFVDPGSRARLLLQAVDVFVLASVPRSEGMPTAILEAMALAKPVVATRVGSVAELVQDGVSGLIADPRDETKLLENLTLLADDEDLRLRMGRAGRSNAEKEFGLDRLADLHAAAIEIALARTRP